MSEPPSPRSEELLAEALDRPLHERARYLDLACGSDEALRQQLEELLATAPQADAYFEKLSEDILGAAPLELEQAVQPRIRIGPYRTEGLLGSGGMGAVYLAARVDGEFDHQVAVKVLHLDMHTPEVRARFLAERQLLARLSHANVAQLHDGGVTDDGRPYFAMEWIDGKPITSYCRDNELSVEQILRLVLQLIEAVSYLHRNLLVHRDLKPSNVLVNQDGQVKLLDFGIAKLLAEEPDEASRTATGKQLLTPQYAAPEQLAGETVTTATDVYALGAMLYELLTGQRPGSDAPPSVDLAPVLPSTLVPTSLRRSIAGDLDNICLQALRAEPERRYPSAEQLGADLERHLQGLPVQARKSTLGYRLSKFVRRYRGRLLAAAALAALVAVGFWRERGLRNEAVSARSAALGEASKAVAVSDFLRELLSSVDPDEAQGREVTVAEVLEEATAKLEGEHALAGEPEVEAALRLTLGSTYNSLSQHDEALQHLERALELRGGLDEADLETLDIAESLGIAHIGAGHLNDAEPVLTRVLEGRRTLLGDEHPDTLEAMATLANLYWRQERLDEVERLDRETLEIRSRVLGADHPDTLRSMNGLAVTLFSLGRYAQAAEMFDRTLVAQRRLLGPNHPDTLMLGNNLAATYNELGRYSDAVSLLDGVLEARLRVLGVPHEDTAQTLHNLGIARTEQGRFREAESFLKRSISARVKRAYGLYSRFALADVLRLQGRLKESESLYLEALGEQRDLRGPDNREALEMAGGLAELRIRQGDLAGAEALIAPVIEAQERVVGSEHPRPLRSFVTLARLRNAQGRHEEALTWSERTADQGSALLHQDHPLVLEAAMEEAVALLGLERFNAAERVAQSLVERRAKVSGEEHPQTVEARRLLMRLTDGSPGPL